MTLTCMQRPSRTHTSPDSPPSTSEAFRCRLKRGRGTAGRLSGRNMLAGAGMMMAFVTGPGRDTGSEVTFTAFIQELQSCSFPLLLLAVLYNCVGVQLLSNYSSLHRCVG